MQFLKKHYEKILLGLVVLGLTAAAAILPIVINGKKDRLEKYSQDVLHRPVKPLPPLETNVQDAAFQRAQGIFVLDLTGKQHNTFNPVTWQKDASGVPRKLATGDLGVNALEVTAIRPLYLIIAYDRFDSGGYFITVERQNAPEPSKRYKQGAFVVKGGSKSDAFVLVDVKGPPQTPTQLLLQEKDSEENISLTPDAPYKKIDGYAADLKYKGEGARNFTDQRTGNTLSFGPNGQYRYKIVAINQNSVVVSAESNKKNTTIPFNPPH